MNVVLVTIGPGMEVVLSVLSVLLVTVRLLMQEYVHVWFSIICP